MPLARPGDPYVTDKGTVMLHDKGPDVIPREEHVLGAMNAKKIVSSSRRTIKDLPIDEKAQTAIIAILGYVLLGMTDNEISHITRIPFDDIQRLKNLPAYQETFDIFFHEMININTNSLQSKIAAFAGDALQNVMNIAENSKQDLAKLKANQDLLDRAGLHPETLFGKNKTDDGFDSLKIVIQNKEDDATTVDVDLRRK